jgi:hypothetical protein
LTEELSMPFAKCWKKLLDLEMAKIVAVETPIPKFNTLNQAITANTNIISATVGNQLTASNPPCIFRIYVVLSVSGILSVQRTKGGQTVAENLNQGVALTAAAAYMFDILVDNSEYIDFQSTATGLAVKMSVVEKDDAK